MTNQIREQQLFRYRSFHINKSQPLGHGSYGAVYKAKCDQLPCAAKVLHPTILDPNDPGAAKIMQRFHLECDFLENIRHPNIVQYLGMTTDPESRLPVLLMELLDESLTKMLEYSRRSLAYCVQVNICHDIALAVAYLHSNGIIHRDLSSNNVLIMAKSRAKVTDFGMSKLASAAPSMTPLTMCPGTLAYMPPEALKDPPVYTKKLDCFSEGVIMIQVCTRLWPEPGPRTRPVPFPASPTGVIEMPVLEPERRKEHINMINHDHCLLPLAMDCLHYQENERPSSEELCQRLAGLKETREYRESVEQVENDIAELERQMGEMQVKEAATVQQLRDEIQQLHQRYQHLESEIRSKDRQIQELNQQLEDRVETIYKLHDENQRQNQQHQSEIQSKDGQIRKLSQQLEEQENVTAELQQTINSLQQQLSQNNIYIAEVERQMGEMLVRETATLQQLHELRDKNQQQHQRCQSEIQSKDRQIHKLKQQLEEQAAAEFQLIRFQSEIQSKDRQIQKFKQQLEEQEQVTAEIQQTNNYLQRQVEQQQIQRTTNPSQPSSPVPPRAHVMGRQLQQYHSIKRTQSQPSPHAQKVLSHQKPHPPKRRLVLRKWRDGESAPYRMARGAAIVDGNVAYFMNWDGQTCSYDSSTQSWNKLPRSPYTYSDFTVIRGLPTAIGGEKGSDSENKLFSILNHQDKKWVEHFPPMPTRRSHTAAITTQRHLIVAGGESGSKRLDTVEVMDIQTLVWSTAASLPHPYSWASATICGDQLYMLGGLDKDGAMTKLVLTCSLTKLLQSKYYSETSSDSVWHSTADIPVYESTCTCAAVNGELVAVGGQDTDEVTISGVYKYNPTTDSWNIISNMPTARYHSLVAVLPTNEMMVVGGYTDKVEIASIQYTYTYSIA